MAQETMLQNYFYLTKNSDGEYVWYDNDPFLNPKAEPINLVNVLLSHYGEGFVGSPIRIRIKGGVVDRTKPFEFKYIKMIQGGGPMHLRDHENHIIEILAHRSQDEAFPLNAVVMDDKGNTVEMRQYSRRGLCKDGVESHALVVVDGVNNISTVSAMEEEKEDGDE